jgi:hypothetical protein
MRYRQFKRLLAEEIRFDVPSNDYLLNHVHEFYSPSTTPQPQLWRRFFAAMLSFCTLLLVGWFIYGYHTPFAVITLEINPAVEITINQFQRVIRVDGINESGDQLIAQVKHRGSLNSVLQSMIETGETLGFIDESGDYALLGIRANSYQSETKITTYLNQMLESPSITYVILQKHTVTEEILYSGFALASSNYRGDAQAAPAQTQPATYYPYIGASPDFESNFDSIINDEFEIIQTYNEVDFLTLAEQLHLTEARLQLLMQIMVQEDAYPSISTLIALNQLDLSELIERFMNPDNPE